MALAVTLTPPPSPASPKPSGTTVLFTAVATGGSGNYQYKFFVNDGSGWVIAKDYGATNDNTWTWNTYGLDAQSYSFQVWVREAGSTAAYEAYTAVATYVLTSPFITLFPDVDFELSVRYRESWKVLVSKSEGEVEQRTSKTTRPIRAWEVSASIEVDADTVKEFLSARRGSYEAFLFRTPRPRKWTKVYLGVGTGANKDFFLPFMTGYTGLKIYEAGVLKTITTHYAVDADGGPFGLPLLSFVSNVAAGAVVEASVTLGRLIPYVRNRNDYYEDTHQAQDHYAFQLALVETKEDVPLS